MEICLKSRHILREAMYCLIMKRIFSGPSCFTLPSKVSNLARATHEVWDYILVK